MVTCVQAHTGLNLSGDYEEVSSVANTCGRSNALNPTASQA